MTAGENRRPQVESARTHTLHAVRTQVERGLGEREGEMEVGRSLTLPTGTTAEMK